MVDDREIVRRQIPQHVDVGLEQAKVHSNGVVVADATELAAVDQFGDPLHGASEQERVIDHEHDALPARQRHQLLGLGDGGAHRFFDKTCFPASRACRARW